MQCTKQASTDRLRIDGLENTLNNLQAAMEQQEKERHQERINWGSTLQTSTENALQ